MPIKIENLKIISKKNSLYDELSLNNNDERLQLNSKCVTQNEQSCENGQVILSPINYNGSSTDLINVSTKSIHSSEKCKFTDISQNLADDYYQPLLTISKPFCNAKDIESDML